METKNDMGNTVNETEESSVKIKDGGDSLHWLIRFVSRIFGLVECPDNYNLRFQPKQLENGKWCLWDGRWAISLNATWITHEPNSEFWNFCEGSRLEVHKVARRLEMFNRLSNG